MKKVALVFVLAVFVPSLVLAWLAVRSLRDQQFLLERQQSFLYQGVADALAKEIQDLLAEYQRSFIERTTALLRAPGKKRTCGPLGSLKKGASDMGFVVREVDDDRWRIAGLYRKARAPNRS